MRITVIVTPEEHAKIKKAAGLVPLSAFAKCLMLKYIEESSYDLVKRGGNGVVFVGVSKKGKRA